MWTQQLLTELKTQLASSQKSNNLTHQNVAKRMAESYSRLNTKIQELGAEVTDLRVKHEALDVEVEEDLGVPRMRPQDVSELENEDFMRYIGAQIFEIYGLGSDIVDLAFCGSVSKIGGLSLDELARETMSFWVKAFSEDTAKRLENFGFIQFKPGDDLAKVAGGVDMVSQLCVLHIPDPFFLMPPPQNSGGIVELSTRRINDFMRKKWVEGKAEFRYMAGVGIARHGEWLSWTDCGIVCLSSLRVSQGHQLGCSYFILRLALVRLIRTLLHRLEMTSLGQTPPITTMV
ncbi:hypothetical protein IFM89_001249 [Coptis chinensis]|uniref:Uncharacterized protein n=1 Tax=Coptis chinensis TaxID=261450 RepID=A0A835LGL0_9MAGN|nr:hypothetical protein IFM89_001249 [Coptis chinensis]